MKKLMLAVMAPGLLLLALVLCLNTSAQALLATTINAITPDTGPADRQTEVVITGQGFISTSTAYLNSTPLMGVTFVDSATLEALVPFGLPTGVYTLTVTDVQSATLTQAFTVTAGTGDWASDGPYGGQTRAIAIHPTVTETLYVAAEQSGLYRTQDGGLHWEQVFHSDAAPVGFVEVWPVDPDVVFFSGEDGLYRSAQGGDAGSWSRVDFEGQPTEQPSALAIAASDPYTLYCAIRGGVFHSADGGNTWEARSTGLPGTPWRLVVDSADAALAYASFQDGTLYRTTDAGQTWDLLPFSSPPTADGEGGITVMATDPYRPDALWLGTWMQGLHRSLDGGQTFTEVASLQTVGRQSGFWSIAFDPNQDRIFVGVSGPNDALYYSDDAGTTWHGLGLNNQGGADIAVTPGDSDTIYTSWAGMRKSTDGGQTWTWLSDGIAAIRPWRIAVSPHNAQRVLTMADSDGAFGTHNSGNEWVTYPISAGGESHQYQAVAFDPVSPTVIYVGGTETVFRTLDDGQTWEPTANMPLDGLPSAYDATRPLFLTVHPQTHTTVYAGVSFFNMGAESINAGALYRSDNGGDSWTRITSTGPISPVNRVALAPSDPDTIYLPTGAQCHWCEGDGIWRSEDGGQTWEHPDSQLRGLRVMALAVHPTDPRTLLAGAWHATNTNDGAGIYRSTDGGDSWTLTDVPDNPYELEVNDIVYDPLDPQIAYAATRGGLRISFNGGRSWEVYPGAMGQLPITALAIAQSEGDTHLYVGTIGGDILGPTRALGAAEEDGALMGAGVYMGQTRWHSLNLPLVVRGAP